MSKILRYMNSQPALETGVNFIIKKFNARDFIMQLPTPENSSRQIDLVPDVEIKFIFSTTEELPEQILEIVSVSSDKIILNSNGLLGLCLNGLSMPPEIFIHASLINKHDPSGNLFEEIVWHETLHAIEGIKNTDAGMAERMTPWSYILQERMKKMDEEDHHSGFHHQSSIKPETFKFIQYLRQGTDAQDNVSEIFARVGVLFLKDIRKNGQIASELITPLQITDSFNNKAADSTLQELSIALATYGPQARDLFWAEFPEMVEQIKRIYGCEPTLI